MGGEAPAVVTAATAVPTYGERRRKKKRKNELAAEIRESETVTVLPPPDLDRPLREFIARQERRSVEIAVRAAEPPPIDRTAEIRAAQQAALAVKEAARKRRIKIFLLLNTE